MTGRASRRKGANGEREVARIFAEHGFDARRTPNSGGLAWRGDLAGVPGYVIEVKRCERFDVPRWLEQAHAAARGGEVPILAFRRSMGGGVAGRWHAALPLEDLARLIGEAA